MDTTIQTHYGDGDIIGGDKVINHTVINNILGKSAGYKELLDRAAELESDLVHIADPAIKLAKSKKLNEVNDQLTQFRQDVIRLAETFARIEINTSRLKIAKEHFDAGRLLEADTVLKSEELAMDQERLLDAKEKK